MPTPLLMHQLRLGGRSCAGSSIGVLGSVVSSIDRHLSALEFLALPTRIRKPPGMPIDRVTQLQLDGIRWDACPRLTGGFVLAFQALQEDLGKVAK